MFLHVNVRELIYATWKLLKKSIHQKEMNRGSAHQLLALVRHQWFRVLFCAPVRHLDFTLDPPAPL